MAEDKMFLTRSIDRFAGNVPEGKDAGWTVDGDRAFAWNRAGDVVSTKTRPGENDATVNFRLMAALDVLGVGANV